MILNLFPVVGQNSPAICCFGISIWSSGHAGHYSNPSEASTSTVYKNLEFTNSSRFITSGLASI